MKLETCYTADFETTTDEHDCRVWAYSLCNIGDVSKFYYGTSIEEFFQFFVEHDRNYKIWFHNLKFDIQFILSFWMRDLGFEWISDRKERRDKTFTTLITDMGQFYSMTIYFEVHGHHTHKLEIFDSFKVFPNLSVEKIAEGFKLPIRKLKIDYKKYRPIGYQLTTEEVDYIRNDVEIVARALKFMFEQGQTKMTSASNAMHYFKEHFVGFRKRFPLLPPEVDEDIRKSYRGGFTYVNEEIKGKLITTPGKVIDVNSLYPSTLIDNPMPWGKPVFFEGQYEEDVSYPLYVQSLSCSFEIKPHHVPSIQLKHNLSYASNEYVKSTHGEIVGLTLTSVDLELMFKQYDVKNVKYHGGWKFKQATGLFDYYVNHWMEQKIKAGKEGNASMKMLSKIQLNSLYGRFAISGKASSKMPYLGDDDIVHYLKLPAEVRETCYLPVACFVTSFGRKKTIGTWQALTDFTLKKYGEDRIWYGDTDSIHGFLSDEDLEEMKDVIKVDDFKLGYWAVEVPKFTRAMYIRQKCYIEEIDGKIHVTVAGLPKYLAPIITFENFKEGFTTTGLDIDDLIEMAKKNGADVEEIEKLHHKLTYKYVPGGVILSDTDFTIQ